jgi:hypothetical protein
MTTFDLWADDVTTFPPEVHNGDTVSGPASARLRKKPNAPAPQLVRNPAVDFGFSGERKEPGDAQAARGIGLSSLATTGISAVRPV